MHRAARTGQPGSQTDTHTQGHRQRHTRAAAQRQAHRQRCLSVCRCGSRSLSVSAHCINQLSLFLSLSLSLSLSLCAWLCVCLSLCVCLPILLCLWAAAYVCPPCPYPRPPAPSPAPSCPARAADTSPLLSHHPLPSQPHGATERTLPHSPWVELKKAFSPRQIEKN
jgi:hypothetical protein